MMICEIVNNEKKNSNINEIEAFIFSFSMFFFWQRWVWNVTLELIFYVSFVLKRKLKTEMYESVLYKWIE